MDTLKQLLDCDDINRIKKFIKLLPDNLLNFDPNEQIACKIWSIQDVQTSAYYLNLPKDLNTDDYYDILQNCREDLSCPLDQEWYLIDEAIKTYLK